MDPGDDLRKRALAAAAKERADGEARSEQYQQERQRRRAALKEEVAKRLQDNLGMPSGSADWEYESEVIHPYDDDPYTSEWLTTTVLVFRERVILTSGHGSRTMVDGIDCECGGSAARS